MALTREQEDRLTEIRREIISIRQPINIHDTQTAKLVNVLESLTSWLADVMRDEDQGDDCNDDEGYVWPYDDLYDGA